MKHAGSQYEAEEGSYPLPTGVMERRSCPEWAADAVTMEASRHAGLRLERTSGQSELSSPLPVRASIVP